jgi:hypothetical protein
MVRAGVPGQIAEMNAQAFRLTAEGDAEWVTRHIPSLLGGPRPLLRVVHRRPRRRVLQSRHRTHGPGVGRRAGGQAPI